jgi:hypothetical protein
MERRALPADACRLIVQRPACRSAFRSSSGSCYDARPSRHGGVPITARHIEIDGNEYPYSDQLVRIEWSWGKAGVQWVCASSAIAAEAAIAAVAFKKSRVDFGLA